jgi:hypothetical protein
MSEIITRLKKRLSYNLNPIARKDYELAIEELTTLQSRLTLVVEVVKTAKSYFDILGKITANLDDIRKARIAYETAFANLGIGGGEE